jgi:DNA-binding FadR family transcriptional regulator
MRLLIADIVSGVRPAGDMLPREVDLAAEFDVSRGVARETIRAMEERGLISVKHGRGATINESDEWVVFDPDVLAATLDSERGSEVLAEYLEWRRVLEVEAAGLAAERAAKRDVQHLAAAMARMEETAARPPSHTAEERFHEADFAFHQALIAATGNRALGGLMCVAQRHLKRLVGSATVAHMGILLCGIALLSHGGLAGVAVFVVGDGLVKASLFVSVGALEHRRDSVDEAALYGRGRDLKALGTVFAVAGLALAALPPFGPFLGRAMIEDAATQQGLGWIAPILVVASAVGGAVLRVVRTVFLGRGPVPPAIRRAARPRPRRRRSSAAARRRPRS